jgi:hypothetical protein
LINTGAEIWGWESWAIGDLMFDYQTLGKGLDVPTGIVQGFEKDVCDEFSLDNTLMEIYVSWATKSCAKANNGC